jgi:hypothetical protein
LCILVICCISLSAVANPVNITCAYAGGQDIFPFQNGVYEELGGTANPDVSAFPADEKICVSYTTTDYRACQQNPDLPSLPNYNVKIVNKTNYAFSGLFYIADPGTTFQNYDANRLNGCYAFLIDNIGSNINLLSESGLADGVFSPGEEWHFVIQDYQNSLGLGFSINSLGVPSTSLESSGSIIAMTRITPEPATMSLLAVGGLALMRKRK